MTPISERPIANPADELVFLPLGGSNEIGMNFNLYGYGPPHARKWVVVDLGVTFGDQTTPGVEIILPDPTFIEEYRKDILGIVLTHAHEDHIGAVAWLWPRLKAPLYATPFTAFLLREKLREQGLLDEARITEIPLKGTLTLGPFEMELLTLTHSIPEPNGVAIRTPLGTILHTGDWKIDPDPLTGEATDEDAIRRLGDEGVLAMVCDSTNVFVDGEAGLRGRGARDAGRPDRHFERQGRRGLFRLQRRADGHHHPRRGGQWAPRLPGRPLDDPHVAGGAFRRPSRRRRTVSVGQRGQALPRRQDPLSLHRQPGRAARRAVADGRRQSPARQARQGRFLRLLLAHHPRQRDPDPHPAEPPCRPGRAALHRARSPRHPRLRPPLPRRAQADVPVG